jgi:HK97 family phage prohead protease
MTVRHKEIRQSLAGKVSVTQREDGQAMVRGLVAPRYKPGVEGTQYELWDGAYERYMPGVFASALSGRADVRCLFNHDSSLVLGRSTAGTVRVFETADGLEYECDLGTTSIARDVAAHLERGDVSGSSAGFIVGKSEWHTEDGVDVRELHEAELFDVSVVTFPAYEHTPTALQAARSEHANWAKSTGVNVSLVQAQIEVWGL